MAEESYERMGQCDCKNYNTRLKVKPFQIYDNVTRRQHSPSVVVENKEMFPIEVAVHPQKTERKCIKGAGGNNYLFINVSNPLGFKHNPIAFKHNPIGLKRNPVSLKQNSAKPCTRRYNGRPNDFSLASFFGNSYRKYHVLIFVLLFITCVAIVVFSLIKSPQYYSYLI